MTADDTFWVTLLALAAWMLPVVSFVALLFIPSGLKKRVPLVSSSLLFLAFISSAFVFVSVWNNPSVVITWNWFTFNGMENNGQLRIDNLSALMLVVVNFISLLVHLFSSAYLHNDAGLKRYYAILGFFTFAMLGIVLSDNLLVTFFFWELVGFSSYLLIGHWREKPEAGAAATKAFLFNRIGDAGFLIGIGLLWAQFNSLHFETIAKATAATDPALLTWISLLLFCGVMGKSAQFPLSTWLPDAMEGPTPVSALIHAATMVAAGVFLMARIYFLFTPTALVVVSTIGSITALWGAFGALKALDIKKILAYSTVSQLGFMILGMGSGSFSGSILHLFTHAFFKACLFLSAGTIIHYLHGVQHKTHTHFDVQDIRNMGGLRQHLPHTFFAFLIAGASLSGVPLLSGFVSKEAILTQLYYTTQNGNTLGWLFLCIAFIISFLTVYYTFRMTYFIFFGHCRIAEVIQEAKAERLPLILTLPVIILAACSVWLIVSWNPSDFSGWIYNGLGNPVPHHLIITVISSIWVVLAFIFAYFNLRNKPRWSPIRFFPDLDVLYAVTLLKPLLQLSRYTLSFDKKWIDGSIHFAAYAQVTIAKAVMLFDRVLIDGAVNGIARLAGGVGSITRSLANGKIQSYILWATASLVIFILWILLS